MSTATTITHELIHEWFTETAARYPAAVAIECGERRLSYGELEERANTFANYLLAHEAGPGTIVAILTEDRSEMIVGMLGSLKAGAAFMPLDVRQPAARLRKLMELAPPQFLLTDRQVVLEAVKVVCVDELLEYHNPAAPVVSSDPDQLSYIYFTSGSSGTPKAIAGRLKGIAHFINWEIEELGVGAGVRVSQLLSPSFDGSLRDIFLPLCVGGVVCVPERREQVLEGRGLVQWLEEARIEVVHCVPSVFRALVNEELRAEELKSLRHVVMAGEALLGRDVARWKAVYGERVGLLNLYGTSETTMAKFSYRVGVGDEEREVMPIGKPIVGAQALILNSNGEPCKRGMVGEIYIRTPYRSLGYYKQPELTAAVFVANPFSNDPTDLVHKTGDMGRVLEDGNFEYLGRRDEQVKVRGARVELKEVENAVRGQAGVLDVAVIEREDASGYTYLCAYLVLAGGVQTVAVAEGLEQELPDYMMPSAYVELEELPRTISGKVDRRALPAVGAEGSGAEYVAARTAVEELLVQSWERLLGRERIGIDDNFFRLGGHSLLATQVMSRVRETFGVEVGLRVLFERPTVRGLGEIIEEKLRGAEELEAPAVTRVSRDGDLVLSFAQQRLWFLDQLEPGSSFYHIPAAVRLRGTLDLTALEQSFREVIRRHESLRTRFGVVNGVPVQLIDEAPEFSLPVLDLSTEAEARRVATEESQRPFDLAAGPLLRAVVLRLGEQEHVLVCTMHHIISDGWSMGVLIRELTTLYEAYTEGKPSPLPDLGIQYADYAHWQREWLQGEVLEQQLSYWKQQLEGAPAVLELPTDYPRPAVQTFRGAHQSLTLPVELTTELKALTQREGVTLFMTLLAAFQTLLWRYSGQEDIVVSTGIANRNRAETEPLIGFFVNTLVLRTDLSGEPPFTQLLKRVREVTLGAYAHQDVPFELLVEALAPERDARYTPLFQVMLVLQNMPLGESVKLPGLELSGVGGESGTAKFDLTMFVEERGEELGLVLEYNTDLFAAATIEQMLESFRRLVEGIVSEPERSIGSLEMIDAQERLRLTGLESLERHGESDEVVSIIEMFDATAALHATAVAIECGERRLSYRELDERANSLANYLIAQGAGRDSIVALLTTDTCERIVGILGTMKAGAAFMPLDVQQPAARLRKLMELAPPQFLLTDREVVLELLPEAVKVVCVEDLLEYHNPVAPAVNSDPDQLSYIYFTSGSSGTPKAIAGRLKGIGHFIKWEIEELGVEAGVRVSQLLSASFDGSLRDIFLPLCVGGVVCVPERREQVLEGRGLVQWLEEARIEVVHCVPSVFRALVNEELRAEELQSLRHVVMAGEALLGRDVARWKAVYGERVGLLNLYGTSETTMAKFSYRVGVGDEEREVMPIGKPIAGAQALILNSNGEPCKRGMVGEIYIRTPYRSLGYYKQPELTAAVFVPNPFSNDPTDLVHKTGDMGRVLEDGNFEYLGRRDEQVKVRGARVELKEVENAVRGQAGVLDVAVIEREDASGYTYLCAYLVLAEGVQTVAVAEGLEQELPDYMMPSAYVELEELPRTISGKVDRRALPAVGAEGSGAEYVAPRTAVEELLVQSWERLLGRERIGIDDNFFRLGGHSLLATQVMSRVRETFGVEVGLRGLFERPTVRGLGEVIEEKLRGAEELEAPAIGKVSRDGELMLSFAQQRLWFLDQLEPGSNAYNMGSAVRLQGTVDLTALEQSFREVIRRHESLRTRFGVVNGVPVQVIDEAPEFNLAVLDLSTLAEAEREAEARRVGAEEAQRPFDLSAGPLLRAGVLRLSEQEHVLLCTMHHIISDGWSMGVLIRELTSLYEAYSTGQESHLPDLEIQYADFAHWQREWLQGEVLDQQLSYWKEQLADVPAVLELPTDYPRPAVQTFRGAHQSLTLSEKVSVQLKEVSQRSGVTLFMTLLAAFQTLLSRYSGQQEIVVGTPIAGRNRGETESLIGFFVNTLVLRTDLSGDPRFEEVLLRVREVALGAYSHQDVPFELLVEELQPERDMSRSPLFQVLMVLQNAPMTGVQIKSDLQMASLGVENQTAKFDLTLSVIETNDGRLQSVWEYNTDLFAPASIRRMMKHFEVLLDEVANHPERRLSELALLTEAERKQIVVEWNETAAEYPREKNVHRLFEEQVERTPDALAVVYENKQVSYGELNERANRLAHYLQSLGVGPETLVGICVERSVEMVVGLLGILKAGAAYVPLDPAYPHERLSYMIEDAEVAVLLTQQHLLDSIPPHTAHTFCLDSEWPLLAECSALNPGGAGSTDNLAYLIYTSGSTGRPKAAAVAQGGFTNLLWWFVSEFAITAADRLLLVSSFSFDLTQKNIFGPLLVGAQLHLNNSGFFDAQAIAELMEREEISLLNCTPSAFYPVVEANESRQLGNLREVFLGGEVINLERLREWRQGSAAEVVNTYGPTECTDVVAYHRVSREAEGVVPIGRGVWNTALYLLDAEMNVVPAGVKGELYIGGAGVGRGYVRDVVLTAERFVPDPYSGVAGARLYRTGDVGRYREDGAIEYLGRVDHQVKVRGYRIELGEVEAALLSREQVKEAVVVVRRDGAGEQQLVAYLVMTDEIDVAAPTSSEWREYLSERLPDYMVPSVFMTLERMPLTPSGKVDRRALPTPTASPSDISENYVAPRTPTEEILTGIWTNVLQVERIGIHDDFFFLGGYSLLAIQVIFQIRDSFQVDLPVRRMFERPTIAGLAEIIEQALKAGQSLQLPMERVSREGELPLSFAQERQWLLDQLMPNSGAYNIPAAVRLRGAFDVSALEQTLTEIVRRHEGLRTTFIGVAGRPLQSISPAQPVRLPVVDLSELPEEERESEARRLSIVESQSPFDLARGPLLRVKVLRLGEEDHVLLYTMHHIISDAWSVNVLVSEVRALYAAFSKGEPSPLPELPIQYADFAHWQRQWLQGEVLEEQINYWQQALADAPAVLDLPTDRPRPAVQSLRGAKHLVALSRELTDSLKELSRREGVTLFMTLLAGFQSLLSRFTGQDHVVVGSATANRTRPEIETLIGYFINHLTLHADLSGDPGFREILRRVRTMCLEAYAHQDVPFEKLLEELRLERDARYSPLFQVMFVLQPGSDTAADPAAESQNLAAREMGVERIGANVDLNLSLVENASGVVGILEYRTDLFDSDTIEYLAGMYLELLEKAVVQPDITLSQFELPAPLQTKVRAARAREQKQTIAIAATFTAEPLEDSLKFWMDQLDLPSNIEFAPYNQVFQQLLDPAGLFGRNQHGVNVVLVRFEDWLRYLEGENDEIERHVRDLLDAFKAATEQQQSATPYIVCVCPASPLQVEESASLFQRMEDLMAAELKNLNGFHLIRSSDVISAYPVENYYDSTTDELGHVPFTPLFFTALGTTIARKLQLLRSAPYKVIVLDCDQTLWKGVCAEDGALGIEIDAPRREFQEFLVAQHDAGMLLCLCSKNQEEDVLEVFEKRSDMPLQKRHLANYRINWRPKSENIIALAEELQLGLDSFIFVDNDPLECAEVQARCPEVLTLELPQEDADITRFLRHVWAFDHLSVTAEDKQRTTLYQQNMERERFRRESFSLEEFLSGLELKIEITEAGPQDWARVAQLTQRTNQFNTSTIRRTEAEIEQLCHSGATHCLVVNVEDRFGNYGLVGVMIFTEEDEAIYVETLLLSCRVLGRGVERRMLIELGKAARERGRQRVDVYYVQSKKNEPALNALQAVAGPYREQHKDGYLFKIPLEVALSLSQFNSETEQGDTPLPKPEQHAVEVRAKSAVIHRIATKFYAPEQILEAIEIQKQTVRSEAAGEYVAPRTPIEEMLAEIWAAVLGVSQVGVNDNFFTLGGHSLLGTVMISRVRDALRVELPLLSLFEAPSVARLSEIVERTLIEQADADDMAEMMKELEDLSEEEISILLSSEGGRLD